MKRILFSLVLAALLGSAGFAATVTKGPIPNEPPTANQLPDVTAYMGLTGSIDLLKAFSDPDATNAVRMTTDFGNIDILLFGTNSPITVANFLRYVNEGRYFYPDKYANRIAPAVIHESLYDTQNNRPLTIQGGEYFGTVSADDKVSWSAIYLEAVGQQLDAIKNEFNGVFSNVTATISMALVDTQHNANGTLVPGTGPDSATSQWFINLGDNGGPPLYLDGNGTDQYLPHVVFGRVLESTMTNVYAIASLPRFDFSYAQPQLAFVPLRNYSQSDYNAFTDPNKPDPTKGPKVDTNTVNIHSITEIAPMTFTATVDNSGIADVAVSGSFLHITPKAAGTAKITVTATDLDGAQVSQSFKVTTATAPARLVNISTRMQVGTGDNALIGGFIVRGTSNTSTKRLLVRGIGPSLSSQGVASPLADPIIELHDSSGALVATNDSWQTSGYAATSAINDTGIPPSNANEAALVATVPATTSGSAYTAILKGTNNGTGVGLVEVYDLDFGPGSTALNISTRGDVDSGENVMIGGFLIGGNNSNKILVRGIGPSLSSQGVSNALADPQLELHNANGAVIDSNDDWQTSSHKSDIQASGIPPSNPKEAAMYDVLAAGAYTAILRGGGATPTGVGLVEIYQLP